MDLEKVISDGSFYYKKTIGDYNLYVHVGKSLHNRFTSFPSSNDLPLSEYLVVGIEISDNRNLLIYKDEGKILGIDDEFKFDFVKDDNLLRGHVTYNQLETIYNNMVSLDKRNKDKKQTLETTKPFYMLASYSSSSSTESSVQYFEKLESAQKALKEKKKEICWRTGLEESSDMHFKFITGWEEIEVTWRITEKRMFL